MTARWETELAFADAFEMRRDAGTSEHLPCDPAPRPQKRTLVVNAAIDRDRQWTSGSPGASIPFLETLKILGGLVTNVEELDVERVILESGSASAADFLELLGIFGERFRGDVLLLNEDGGGFLSTFGLGGERVLFSPTRSDVELYFNLHGLTQMQRCPGARQYGVM